MGEHAARVSSVGSFAVRHPDVEERSVAIGNSTRLQEARKTAGWSQQRLIAAMRASAKNLGMTLPDDDGLKTNLTRWENGHVGPGARYRRLFRTVYGMTDEELGFASPDDDHPSSPPPADLLSSDALSYYGVLLGEHVRADNVLGPHVVQGLVREQLTNLSAAARQSRGPGRQAVINMACRYHEFYGWLLQDAGRYEQAMVATDRARDLATELHDAPLATYLLMRKSNIASDADDAGLALGLAEAAVTSGNGLSPKVRAVAYRQKANAHAALGDRNDFLDAMNNAFEAVDQDDSDGDELAAYCTPAYIAMEAATAWMELSRPDLALQVFEQATADGDDTFRRDHGLYLARRASACAGVDDIEGACQFGMQALLIANATRSTRTIRQLRRLRSQLMPLQARPPVAALVGGVARLVGSSA